MFKTYQLVVGLLLSEAYADCQTTAPTGISIDAAQLAGTWYLNKSTHYRNDRVCAASLQLSEPNSNDKVSGGFFYFDLFAEIPFFSKDGMKVDTHEFYYSSGTDGQVISTDITGLSFLDEVYGTVIETDYTDYMVMYKCETNYTKVLNMDYDTLDIYTRSGTLSGGTETTINTALGTKLPNWTYSSELETLDQNTCRPHSKWSQFKAMMTDPSDFFRK